MKKAIVIAEIGCSHIGNIERAKKLIKLAKNSGAEVAKFQKRNPTESTPKNLRDKPHPNELFAYGSTYLEHRINLELNIEQHKELQSFCNSIDIQYATSVWDFTSAKEIIALNPILIKIPSACNTNINLINYILENYNGEVHLSLGMLTPNERNDILNNFYNFKHRIVIYHCTSIYPCPFDKLYLNEIKELSKQWPRVGFSNHGFGIAADIAAYMLGATYIERHFIDDRTFRHNDAAASLEPVGLFKLCRDLKAINASLSIRPDILSEDENKQKQKLKIII